MSARSSPSTSELRASIRAVEDRIRKRREKINVAFDRVSDNAREHLISPPALIAAFLVGVALHRSQGLHHLQSMGLLDTANSGLRLLQTARGAA